MTDGRSSFSVAVKLEGVEEGEERPSVALYLLGANGRVEKKVASVKDDRLSILHEIATRNDVVVALGPDVENPQGLSKDMLMQFRSEELRGWTEGAKLIHVPKSVWPGWLRFLVCLWRVERCLPIIGDPLLVMAGLKLKHPVPFPRFAPVCNGIVEIYERECCCSIREVPIDIDYMIRRLEKILATYPPILYPSPGPVKVDRALLYRIQLARSTSSPTISGIPDFDPLAEIQKLSPMLQAEAEKYVRSTEFYRPFLCSCGSRNLGVSRSGGSKCEPVNHAKRSFALNPYVWAKHWNGGGRLSQHDASDQTTFSLEV